MVMLPSGILKLPTDLPVRDFPSVETSPSWLPPQDGSVPLTLLSLFVFYILSYLPSKRMGCLYGCLVSSASIQKLFCGSCLAFKGSLDEFVGEKVISPSYSSAILGPPSLSLNLSTFLSLVYPQCPRRFLSDLLPEIKIIVTAAMIKITCVPLWNKKVTKCPLKPYLF